VQSIMCSNLPESGAEVVVWIYFFAIHNSVVLMWYVRLPPWIVYPCLWPLRWPSSYHCWHKELRLLQCHTLSIYKDFSGQHSDSIFRIILSKNLVLFFDCLALKTEVLRFFETLVAICQSTELHTAQDLKFYERTPLRKPQISQTL
jgi:hypothetical protein